MSTRASRARSSRGKASAAANTSAAVGDRSTYAALPLSSTRMRSWCGPRHELPAMTRSGSHG